MNFIIICPATKIDTPTRIVINRLFIFYRERPVSLETSGITGQRDTEIEI